MARVAEVVSVVILVLFSSVLLASAPVAKAQGSSDPVFAISTTGTFLQSAQYNRGICDYCNCPSTCNWYNNYVCPQNPAAGADDNQERWGTCSLNTGCPCFNQSGAGFQGVSNLQITANQPYGVVAGKFTHYNNPTKNGAPTLLRLLIKITADVFPDDVVLEAPLDFLETDNTKNVSTCDPSIQESSIPCDDMFSFQPLSERVEFTSGDTLYALEINGFIKNGTQGPAIRRLVTTEGQSTTANIIITINATCNASACGPNETPKGLPDCGCQCNLNSSTCSAVFGSNWGLSKNGDCGCSCGLTSCTNANEAVNLDTCSCGCNVTSTDCHNQNHLWVASTTECGCACNTQAQIDCHSLQPFYRALMNESCDCGCAITDEMCANYYGGADWVVNPAVNCGCQKKAPPSDGDGSSNPSPGGWVGIIIGICGIIIIGFFLAGVLSVLLIKCGIVPGVFGH